MSQHLHRDVESLEQDLLAQSSRVEQMIQLAVQALKEQQSDFVVRLLRIEETVNTKDVEIEEECLKLLALHQPVAKDLRRVATVLKVNADLERIADLAVNLGERAQSLVIHCDFPFPEKLVEMADISITMVRDAIDALVQLNADAAREICLKDDEVDALNRECIIDLQELVMQNSADFEPALLYFSASRHIERIADHATNIAEDVIYLVTGEITRHSHGISL